MIRLAVPRAVVGIVSGVDIHSVRLPAAGSHDVQRFACRGRGDVGVGGVDGAALGPVGGGGVPELEVLSDIGSGQDRHLAAAGTGQAHRPVVPGFADDPVIAVLDPAAPRGQCADVEPGDDHVPDPDGRAVGGGDTTRQQLRPSRHCGLGLER